MCLDLGRDAVKHINCKIEIFTTKRRPTGVEIADLLTGCHLPGDGLGNFNQGLPRGLLLPVEAPLGRDDNLPLLQVALVVDHAGDGLDLLRPAAPDLGAGLEQLMDGVDGLDVSVDDCLIVGANVDLEAEVIDLYREL